MSEIGQLNEQLKQRSNQRKELHKQFLKDELQNWSRSLSECVDDELSIIEHDIERTCTCVQNRLIKAANFSVARVKKAGRTEVNMRQVLYSALVMVPLLAGVLTMGCIKGVNMWIDYRLTAKREEVVRLEETVKFTREMKTRLDLWGIGLVENQAGKWILLPPNLTLKDMNTWGEGNQALLLEED